MASSSESEGDVSSMNSDDPPKEDNTSNGNGKNGNGQKAANGNGSKNGNGNGSKNGNGNTSKNGNGNGLKNGNGKKNGNGNGAKNGNGAITNGKINGNGKPDPFNERGPPNGKYMVKRLAKISRNPFLNFVRQLRMKRDFRTVQELVKAAGAEWKNMSDEAKREYVEEATTVDSPIQPAPFYKLGEHKLGTNQRKNLIKFKTLMDNAVEKNLAKIQKKERLSKDDSD